MAMDSTLDQYQIEYDGDYRIYMTESCNSFEKLFRYYGDGVRKCAEIPFNFYYLLFETNKSSKASYSKYMMEHYLNHVPDGYDSNWVVNINKTFHS